MSFFNRLFRFRERETHAPVEDFLTELLAEWLRQATSAGKIRHVLTDLLGLPAECLPPAGNLSDLIWETQHVIGPGHRGEGKRPDLIGRGPAFFLIVENKIAADFTRHEDDEGEIDQLGLYESYRNDRSEPFGGIILLTQSTLPPQGWTERTRYWSTVEKYLRTKFAVEHCTDKDSSLHYFTRQLTLFLGEHGMNGTRIALADITSYPAYLRLMEGLSKLGRIGANRLSLQLQGANLQQLRTPRGGSSGDFVWPTFHGVNLSEGGARCHDAQFIFWSGVVAGSIYEHIAPATEGIPDLSVGVGLWFWEPSDKGEAIMNQMLERLKEETGTPWQFSRHLRDNRGPVALLWTRRSLIDLHVQAEGGDLDDYAKDFFEMHCRALIQALDERGEDGDSRESHLLKLARGNVAQEVAVLEPEQPA